jgi:hypothetical protein
MTHAITLTTERAAAIDEVVGIARGTEGVRDVKNELVVKQDD